MKTPDYGWHVPSVYSRRHGVVKQKRRPYLKIALLVGLAVNGAVFMAGAQLSQQFDSVAEAQQNQVQEVKEIPLPAQLATGTPKTSESQVPVDPELQRILETWAKNHAKQDWSVVFKGLGDDKRYASLRGDSWYVPASLYKLLIMKPLFEKYDVENLESQKINVDGSSKSVKSCVEAMLKWSDNPCGEAMGKYLGWYRVDSSLQKAGLKQTQLNRKDVMFANASDVNKLLEGLYDATMFTSSERDFILKNMQQGNWRKGIPSGCYDCVVANKTGDLSNVRHDSAIVTYPGGAYALTIMTSGAKYSEIAELTKQIHNYIVQTMP